MCLPHCVSKRKSPSEARFQQHSGVYFKILSFLSTEYPSSGQVVLVTLACENWAWKVAEGNSVSLVPACPEGKGRRRAYQVGKNGVKPLS